MFRGYEYFYKALHVLQGIFLIPYGMPHIVLEANPAHGFDLVSEKIIISPFIWNLLSAGERDR